MILSNTPTKFQVVEEIIVQQINNGVLRKGERLKSIRDLSAQFEVSISVIQAVFDSLENKGLIERKRSNGVYVKNYMTALPQQVDNQVLLSVNDQGHVYEELTEYMRKDLLERGFLPITFNNIQLNANEGSIKYKKNVNAILSSKLKGVIIDGNNYWRCQFMENYPNVRLVFINMLDFPGPMPERAVLLDFESASYKATAHLAQMGRKKIMLCTFKPDPLSLSPETITRHHSTQLLNGYERALREYDIIAFRRIFYYTDTEINAKNFKELMTGKDAPDAIMCFLDYPAMQWVMEALKAGMKVPDDLMVTGMNNTPWTMLSPVPLTSIAFDWKDLALKATGLLLDDDPKTKVFYFKPQLIKRKSTGGTSHEKP